MSYFQIKELERVEDDDIHLAIAEIMAVCLGECGIEDIPCDNDELAKNYANSRPKDQRLGYLEEPQLARKEALDNIEGSIRILAESRAEQLGRWYPFVVAPRDGVLLARKAGLRENVEGTCYLCMQLHLLYSADRIEFGMLPGGREEKPHLDFTQPFQKLFEIIAGIAIANETGGLPILLGESRSTKRQLLARLSSVCRCAERGAAKAFDQLNLNQRQSNDGGIDAVILKKKEDELQETILVGATIQKSHLRKKMVDPQAIHRFRGFLIDGDALSPYRGFFAHPMPYDIGRRGLCGETNCRYFHKDDILRNLRPLSDAPPIASYRKTSAERSAIVQLRRIGQLTFRLEFDDYRIDDAIVNAEVD
ncbi:hypothetical protein [Oceaniradius stylonematis]|uniref:hypothetical protein n=1 Tax=Oceaniradius stylonematis TaxID=2184161 RepID=UPI0011C42164|nr:hypothetical protein [Oceaniradius stylonematis]